MGSVTADEDLSRQMDEVTALEAIYGPFICEELLWDCYPVQLAIPVGEGTVRVEFSRDYPSRAPLIVAAVDFDAPAAVRQDCLEALRCLAAERLGMESCTDVVAAFEERLQAAAVAEAAAVALQREEAGAAENGDAHWASLIAIDHMNDAARYLKCLRSFLAAEGLTGRLLHKERTPGKRVEGILLLVAGARDAEPLRSFATRLRTEYVDVDKCGKKCKERQSTVLASGKIEPPPSECKKGADCLEELQPYSDVEGVLRLFDGFGVGGIDGVSWKQLIAGVHR
eukprot:TRINITY_DN114545_c0_g1_i1.p1 TRINITY_DN114545_c0_g1~~TRINITY_DN114545_c0_g1_i1.p1  ORF type:complete len:308 (-),score=73.69 TRINITY_DN114545_c0_g1_i1:600-1448(-)